jgi:hypothetical protein
MMWRGANKTASEIESKCSSAGLIAGFKAFIGQLELAALRSGLRISRRNIQTSSISFTIVSTLPLHLKMSNPPAPNPSRGGGLSLYANLLDLTPSSNTTSAASISRGPVVFKQGSADNTQVDDASVKKQQINPGRY